MKFNFTRSNRSPLPPALVEQLATSVAVLDSNLHFVGANGAFCELFETGSPKLLGVPLEEFGRAGQIFAPIAERARAQQTAVASRGERVASASGHVFSADIIASAVDGGVLLEVHRTGPEGAVGGPPSRLSESLRGLAHEVKNPLAGIRGAAQLLRRRVGEPELARLADMIMTEADRLANLADRLLHGGRKPHLTQYEPARGHGARARGDRRRRPHRRYNCSGTTTRACPDCAAMRTACCNCC